MALLGCAPDLTVHASRIATPRVVAVRAEPAEARPGETVMLAATVATPRGMTGEAAIDWRACLIPRSPAESATVSARCLMDDDAGSVNELAVGQRTTTVMATVPADACTRVGPQTPAQGQGGERVRAPDPDITGGWQLPIRLGLSVGEARETLFARFRVRCQPPDVPGTTAVGYALRYRNNVNPALAGVFAVVNGATRELPRGATTETAVGTGRAVPLLALWGAEAAERYVAVDPTTRALVDRTEALELTWFTDGGELARDRTAPDGSGTASANVLRLDEGVTSARVWVALRDERGGVDVATLRVRLGE